MTAERMPDQSGFRVVDQPVGPSGGITVTTSTDVREREDTRDTGTDDTPKMFHYVRKKKIAESAVMGNFVVALCGETFPVTKSPKPGSPVCPECERIFKSLPPGKKD